MSPEATRINVLHKDKTSSPVGLDALVDHLRKLNLRHPGAPGAREGRSAPLYLTEHGTRCFRFEIFENNDTVVMDADRKDGTITRCYLWRGNISDEIHLQVTSGLKPNEPHPGSAIKDAEVHGRFPIKIKYVCEGYSNMNGGYIGFYGSDRKSGIRVTRDGKVRFS